jgi:tRNA(Ile2) C34 agmatinyltransferase TiaS
MTSEEIRFKVDSDIIGRIREKYPDLNIALYLKHQLAELVGVRVRCPKCGYSWPYTGNSRRVKCNRCRHNVRVRRRIEKPQE